MNLAPKVLDIGNFPITKFLTYQSESVGAWRFEGTPPPKNSRRRQPSSNHTPLSPALRSPGRRLNHLDPRSTSYHIFRTFFARVSEHQKGKMKKEAFTVSTALLVHGDKENTNQPDCRFSMVSFTSLWPFTPRIHNTAVPGAIWALAPCPGARAFPHTTTLKRVYPR